MQTEGLEIVELGSPEGKPTRGRRWRKVVLLAVVAVGAAASVGVGHEPTGMGAARPPERRLIPVIACPSPEHSVGSADG